MSEMTAEQAFATANQYYNSGRLREAEMILQRTLAAVPDHPRVLELLAIVMHQLGRGSAGIELLRRALDLEPDNAGFRSNLGAMLAGYGEPVKAAAELRKAIALAPNLADAHNNLGNVLRTLGEPIEAVAEFRKSLAAKADLPEAHNNLGASLQELGRLDEALDELRGALRIRPDYPEALNNLGNVLQELGRPDEAIEKYRSAITIRPNYAEAHQHLAIALRSLNRLDEAMREFRTALELRPRYAEALWGISFLMLLQGDFSNGWRTFESRQHLSHRSWLFDVAQPLWEGESLEGKSILLYGEQGLGDVVQFARYVPMVKARGGKVVVACQSTLKRFLVGQVGIESIVTEGFALPSCDLRCALMSLPRIFQTTPDTIPAKVPYLRADPALSQRWKGRLGELARQLNVGLVWAGNRKHLNDRNRSIPLSAFEPLRRIPGLRLISLQKGDAAGEATASASGMVDWTSDLSDLAETAALVDNLDLVISVDTSVAHLAGAMGKRAWTLIPFAPDWRWMLNRSDSPWYPTMRLFRQPALHDWATPIRQLAAELNSLATR
jgi:Flp pilus assembly protein TadD